MQQQQGRRKRGRISKACSQCHSRKQKCDGSVPCRNCSLRGVENLCKPRTPSEALTSQQRASRHSRRLLDEPGSSLRGHESRQQSSPDAQLLQPSTPPIRDQSSHAEETQIGQDTETSDRILSNGDAAASREDPGASIGQLWKSRGAPSFFGGSYFGPQVAAALLDTSAPYVQPGANMSVRTSMAKPFRDEAGPFSQLWDLLGMLPRQRATVDRLVDLFLNEVNWQIDAVHPTSFRQAYERFYDRKIGLDDVATVDIRWLALLFIILAIGAYLDCPTAARPEVQQEYEESSMRFFWACRKAIVIAPSFYGESTDLVRTGILVTRYCLFSQRITESWLTVGFAARLAMAQGLHIDGAHWKLPRRVTESRRRLWCQLYLLDRMISLALGRPYCILDNLSLTREPDNVFLDDLTHEEADVCESGDVATSPTPSVPAVFSHRLAKVIGQIQEQTFGMRTASYRQVMKLDAQLLTWKRSLPSYFAIDHPDTSLDEEFRFLKWHRVYLHTSYHFACITLHRPFVWRGSVTDQHRYSREICLSSACTDLRTRLGQDDHEHPAAHFTWGLSVPQLFNSAIILGLLAIQGHVPFSQDTAAVINDLEAYCDKERSDIWVNDFRLAEVKVVELCIDRLRRRATQAPDDGPWGYSHPSFARRNQRQPLADNVSRPIQPQIQRQQADTMNQEDSRPSRANANAAGEPQRSAPSPAQDDLTFSLQDQETLWSGAGSDETMFMRPGEVFYDAFSLPGPTDLVTWQNMIDSLDSRVEP